MNTITIDGKSVPAELFLLISDDKSIELAARLEAEMLFLKFQAAPEKESSRCVHIYPEYVSSRENMFQFAMAIGEHLFRLKSGVSKVSAEARMMFGEAIAVQPPKLADRLKQESTDSNVLMERARKLAADKMVRRNQDSFEIGDPDYDANPVQKVSRTADGIVTCTCEAFQNRDDTAFRCEHILAVKYFLLSK